MERLSIGALSRATDVPVETLRTWERRYGFPTPERLPSGHRRYPPATAERLALVRRAIEAGERASEAIRTPPEELRRRVARGATEDADVAEAWLPSVRKLRAADLERHLRLAWDRHGAQAFVEEFAVPFLRSLGERWAEGRIAIVHEHFATEHLRDFLAQQWRRLEVSTHGPPVVLATLPGEPHEIGLHLAATLLTLHGRPVVLLGRSTPPDQIVQAVRDSGALAVLVGTSPVPPRTFRSDLDNLLERLRGVAPVLVGGPLPDAEVAARGDLVHLARMGDLTEWCRRSGPRDGARPARRERE